MHLNLHSKCVCEKDLTGTITIVTGANCGIGFETAKALADKGSRIILACRSEARGSEALDSLLKENPKRKVELEILDLSSLASVRSFADRVNRKIDKLDILVNNAGLCIGPCVTEDGYEMHFGVNHLGHFLLTNLLLDKLKKAPEARVINVSSEGHRLGKFDPSKLKEPYNGWKMIAYGNSKLCNILFTRELSERLQGTNVKTFSLHPGAIATNFGRNFNKGLLERYVYPVVYTGLKHTVLKDPVQGAQTTIHAALNKEILKQPGSYLKECAVSTTSNAAYDTAKAKELWTISEDYAGLSKPAK